MGFVVNNKNQSTINREVSGVNVGTIVEFPKGTTLPSSFLDANGSQYDENVWVDLYRFLGTNKLPNAYVGMTRVGDVKWFQNRNNLPYGWTPADGNNVIPYTDFPDVKSALDSGRLVSVDEAVYTSDTSKRASWAKGASGFRTPDYNGKSAGSLGSLFLRGDGGVAAPVGAIQGDASRVLSGTITLHAGADANIISGTTGIFYQILQTVNKYRTPYNLPEITGANSCGSFGIDSSRVAPTAVENRPLNTAGCWAVCLVDPNVRAIKAAGFVDNDGLLSAVGVLNQVSDLRQNMSDLRQNISNIELEGKWYRGGSEFFNKYFEFAPTWDYSRANEIFLKKTGKELRVRGILRRSAGAFPNDPAIVLYIKNPDRKLYIGAYQPFTISSPVTLGSGAPAFPQLYVEQFSSSEEKIPVICSGLKSFQNNSTFWIMFDFTFICDVDVIS